MLTPKASSLDATNDDTLSLLTETRIILTL